MNKGRFYFSPAAAAFLASSCCNFNSSYEAIPQNHEIKYENKNDFSPIIPYRLRFKESLDEKINRNERIRPIRPPRLKCQPRIYSV